MRIKNKLITVQLIMTITLFLSILFFSIHMNRNMQIDDAEIVLSHLDSNISRFKIYIDTSINKRLSASDIQLELENRFDYHKEYIDFLQNSNLFTSSTLKESTKDFRSSYVKINSQNLQIFTTILNETIDENVNNLMIERGVVDSLKLLRNKPATLYMDNDEVLSAISKLEKLYSAHNNLKNEYITYYEQWNSSKNQYSIWLEQLRRNSIIRTIILISIIISLSFYFGFRITNIITRNLNEVNKSLAKMTSGDFTSNLNIDTKDEFGDLSKSFNSFIEELWKKLDSMNVIMSDISRAMNEDLDINKIQNNILDNITNQISTDSAAILSLKDGVLKMTSSRGHFPPFFPIEEDLSRNRQGAINYLINHDVPLDSALIQKCLETGEPILVKDCSQDINFPQCKNRDSALFIGSLMMVPLINAGNVLGVFVVLRTSNEKEFSDLDFSNFSSFCDYASLTIDTLEKYNELIEKFEMQKEIGVAADIQKSLVPGKMPTVKGLTSSAYTLAAKGVSGDYYDFFRMNKYTIGATVCDVAGKGVPASLVMVMIRTILRLVSSPSRGAAETLTMLNKSISGKINVDRYATMSYFKIDLENMKLNYSNAAHHPIQIFRQSTQKFYAIDSPGLPIGIDRNAKFSEKRVSIFPGDIIFMYTDGFPEARNAKGDEYSTHRMLREIRLHCNSDANKILDSVVTDMQKFTARATQHDDQTMLIIKIDEDK